GHPGAALLPPARLDARPGPAGRPAGPGPAAALLRRAGAGGRRGPVPGEGLARGARGDPRDVPPAGRVARGARPGRPGRGAHLRPRPPPGAVTAGRKRRETRMRNAVGAVDTVLLLGGRSEIGLAIAERLVRDGARRVVLAAREAAGGRGLAEEAERLRAAGAAEVHPVEFDAADTAGHEAVVAEAVKLAGDLDAVVDAFGVLGEQAAFEADPAAAAAAAAATFTGHVSADLAVAARLREQGHGTLVVLSSVAGVRVRRANFVYGAAKAGLDGLAQGLGDALHGTG